MVTHLLLQRRLWTVLWASQKQAGSTSCQGVWGPVRPSWDNLPLTPLHTHCCYTASVTKQKHATGTRKFTKSVVSSLLNTIPDPQQMARYCRDGHQGPGRGCCLVSPLPRLNWVLPCWQHCRGCGQHRQHFSLWSVTTDSTKRGIQKHTEILPLVTLPFCDKRDKRA